jgi:hypothetical protein
MSRRLSSVLLAAMLLTAAMGLKTIATRGNGAVLMANGSAPLPQPKKPGTRNGSAPLPQPKKPRAMVIQQGN